MAGLIQPVTGIIHQPDGTYDATYKLDQHGFSTPDSITIIDQKYGTVTENLPIAQPENAISGHSIQSYIGDLYERIHVTPSNFDLGNILASTQQNIDVWNAYTATSITLNQITKDVVDDSVEITEPLPSPLGFAPQQVRSYTLNVSNKGPNTSDVVFTFDFDVADIDVSVSAIRIVVNYYTPQQNVLYTMEYLTSVIQAYDTSETTQQLRDNPREIIIYEFNSALRSAISNIIASSQFLNVSVPRWTQWADLTTALSVNDIQVYCDLSRLDVNVNDSIFLYRADGTHETIKVISIGVDHYVIDPITQNFALPTVVMSTIIANTEPTVDFDMYAVGGSNFKIKFTSIKPIDVGTYDLPDQHNTYDLLRDGLLMPSSTIKYTSIVGTDLIDYGAGPFEYISRDPDTSMKFQCRVYLDGYDNIRNRQKWINKIAGQNGRFYVVGYGNEFKPKVDIEATDTSINIDHINFNRIDAIETTTIYVYLELLDGTYYVRELLSATEVDGNTESLALASAFGVAIPVTSIRRFDRLHFVRMVSDSVTFKFERLDVAELMFDVIETR